MSWFLQQNALKCNACLGQVWYYESAMGFEMKSIMLTLVPELRCNHADMC